MPSLHPAAPVSQVRSKLSLKKSSRAQQTWFGSEQSVVIPLFLPHVTLVVCGAPVSVPASFVPPLLLLLDEELLEPPELLFPPDELVLLLPLLAFGFPLEVAGSVGESSVPNWD